jgi:hypothetical protein
MIGMSYIPYKILQKKAPLIWKLFEPGIFFRYAVYDYGPGIGGGSQKWTVLSKDDDIVKMRYEDSRFNDPVYFEGNYVEVINRKRCILKKEGVIRHVTKKNVEETPFKMEYPVGEEITHLWIDPDETKIGTLVSNDFGITIVKEIKRLNGRDCFYLENFSDQNIAYTLLKSRNVPKINEFRAYYDRATGLFLRSEANSLGYLVIIQLSGTNAKLI